MAELSVIFFDGQNGTMIMKVEQTETGSETLIGKRFSKD